MRISLVILSTFLLLSAAAEKQPLERYQSIIDRQMFGALPPGFDPSKLPSEVQKSSASEKELTQEQAKLKSAVHFSVINVASDGQTEVGFTDNSNPKAPKHYFMKVGEAKDGWTVKEADAEKATMTISKDEIEVFLTLGGNSATDAAATTKAGGATTPVATPAMRGSMGKRGGLLNVSSLRSRRLLRQQEAAAAAQAQAQEQAEKEAREAERQAAAEAEKAQRDQERAEQRQQLLAIQEELKRVREAKTAETTKTSEGEGAQDNAQ